MASESSPRPADRGAPMADVDGFKDEQKHFLQGFAMGADVARAVRGLPILSGSAASPGTTIAVGPNGTPPPLPSPSQPGGPYPLQVEAQDRFLAQGRALCKEEQAKREKDPFSMWDEMGANAAAGAYPKGTDVLLYKFSGLFHVAPAQDSFMSRLRIPGGALPTWQFRGVADLARRFGAGHVDATTRANLQVREIQAGDARDYLVGLADYGLVSRGSGADNIRNCTASPTSGFDPVELIETLPMARAMHHYILNHREMYGLPRKFNIAFEGGGRVASLEDTNDIGFKAVRFLGDEADLPAGVYFRPALGGITGHKDFARDTGVLLRPEECVEVAGAIVRVYLKNGDRTDRKKARLKYVLDDWGFPRFLEEVEKELGRPLPRVALDRCEAPAAEDRWAHVGFHPQKQPGKVYVGVVLPVGRMTSDQVDGLADIADRFGGRSVRLTVWQNLLIPDIARGDVEAVKLAIEALGLHWDASGVRSGLVACTGNAGCKFAGADTKRHAMEIAGYLEARLTLDRPINIHVTGCPNSCAQHYIGDIGLEGTRVEVGDELVEGYHLCVGGGWGAEQGTGRRLLDSLPVEKIPPIIERLIGHYLANRAGPDESFALFARRHEVEALRSILAEDMTAA
jgi:ferredoxin-nitrite reductase